MKPQSSKSQEKINPVDAVSHAAKRLKTGVPEIVWKRKGAELKTKFGGGLASIPKDKRAEVTLDLRATLATHLATIGAVHPLIPETKRPATRNGVHDATQDPKIIRDWCARYPNCNWGITRNVVDVDSAVKEGNTHSGSETWNPIVVEHGEPDTYKVTTPSGGEHYYVQEELPNKANSLGEGIDSRATGKGYVVAAGSHVTKNEKERVAITGFYMAVNHKPINSVPWITTLKGYTSAAPERGDEVENPEPVITNELLAECLAKLDPAQFRDQGKWEALMMSCHHATAGQGYPEWSDWSLSDKGYNGNTDNIENRWNSLHVHEGGDKQIDSEGGLIECLKEAGAVGMVSKIYGLDCEEPANDNEEATTNAEAKPKHVYHRGYMADKLLSTVFPPLEEIIEGMLLEELPATLDGDGGVGKSLISAQMAVHRAAGKDFLGRKVKQGPAIFITAEDRYNVVKERMTATARYLGLTDQQFAALPLRTICIDDDDLTIAIIDDKGNWKKGPFYDTFDSLLAEMPGALVFLDCRTDFAQGDFVTSRDVPNTFYKKVITALNRQHHTTIVPLCHPSKASMESGDFYEGTTANRTAVRGKLVMKLVSKKDQDGPRWFGNLKRQYGKNGGLIKVTFNTEFGIFTPDTEPNLTAETLAFYAKVIEKVLELIEQKIVVCKHSQSSGQGPEAIAKAIAEDDPDALEPLPKEIVAALEWGERRGKIRHVPSDKNKHIREHYEAPTSSETGPA